jgi:hypothetical protein
MENLQIVSALEEPEKAAALAASVFTKAPGDIPDIEPPPDGNVTLPGGFLDLKGELHTEATVRELTGADEEALQKPEVMKNFGRFTQVLLQRGVTRVGTYDNPGKDVLGNLLIGDRDMLMLAIRRVTYGDTLEMKVNCPACGEELNVEHDLAKDVPIKKMDDPRERMFTMELRDGRKVTCSLAVGSDQEAILSIGQNKSLAEITSMLLARCVKWEDGRSLGLDGVRNMGALDRRNLAEEITGRQPGPQYSTIDLDCAACGKDFPMVVDVQDLFR